MDNTPTAKTNKRGSRFFDENLLHPKATPIDAPKFIEFDWECLRRHLGEANEEMSARDYATLADVLGELLRWIVKGDNLKMIGRRSIALAWVVNPDIFQGKSAARLAKAFHFPKLSMHIATADARRAFGVTNRAQQHGWNFRDKPGKPRRKARRAAKARR